MHGMMKFNNKWKIRQLIAKEAAFTHFLKFLGLLESVKRTRRTIVKSTRVIGFNISILADTPPKV